VKKNRDPWFGAVQAVTIAPSTGAMRGEPILGGTVPPQDSAAGKPSWENQKSRGDPSGRPRGGLRKFSGFGMGSCGVSKPRLRAREHGSALHMDLNFKGSLPLGGGGPGWG